MPEENCEIEIESGWHRLGRSLAVLIPVIAATFTFVYGFAEIAQRAWPLAADVSYGFTEDVQSRIRDATSWQAESDTADLPRLSVVVGASSMREAVSISALNDAHTPEWKVMGLCGAGASLKVIVDYLDRLMQSSVQPDHVVIGLGPYLFNDFRTPFGKARKDQENGGKQTVKEVDAPTSMITRIAKGIHKRQTLVSLRAETGLRSLRESMHGIEIATAGDKEANPFGFDLANRDPFREVFHMFEIPTEEARNRRVARELVDYSTRDYFHRPSYDAIEQVGSSFIALVRDFLEQDVCVTVIFLPEYSVFRDRIPTDVPEQVSDYLQRMTADHAMFRLVDTREQLPDNAFYDLVHVSPAGREQLTPILTSLLVPPEPSFAHDDEVSETENNDN